MGLFRWLCNVLSILHSRWNVSRKYHHYYFIILAVIPAANSHVITFCTRPSSWTVWRTGSPGLVTNNWYTRLQMWVKVKCYLIWSLRICVLNWMPALKDKQDVLLCSFIWVSKRRQRSLRGQKFVMLLDYSCIVLINFNLKCFESNFDKH
jgi:hypothetical protein